MRVEDVHVDGFYFFVKVKRRFLRVNKCLLPKKHSNENTRSQKSPHLDQGRSCNQIQLYGLNFLRCEPVQWCWFTLYCNLRRDFHCPAYSKDYAAIVLVKEDLDMLQFACAQGTDRPLWDHIYGGALTLVIHWRATRGQYSILLEELVLSDVSVGALIFLSVPIWSRSGCVTMVFCTKWCIMHGAIRCGPRAASEIGDLIHKVGSCVWCLNGAGCVFLCHRRGVSYLDRDMMLLLLLLFLFVYSICVWF